MLISFAVTAKLICIFVFAYAKSRFSHDAAHIAVEWKPYKSAYGPKETETTTTASSGDDEQYYCKICEKQLNGPIPYNMHLNSKAHKEELEVHMDM